MKKSKEEASGWCDQHSKCVCVLVGGWGAICSQDNAEGKKKGPVLFFQLSWQPYLMAGHIHIDYHGILKA